MSFVNHNSIITLKEVTMAGYKQANRLILGLRVALNPNAAPEPRRGKVSLSYKAVDRTYYLALLPTEAGVF
jgi:hypothetical protein